MWQYQNVKIFGSKYKSRSTLKMADFIMGTAGHQKANCIRIIMLAKHGCSGVFRLGSC
jgi:hypothetical protein